MSTFTCFNHGTGYNRIKGAEKKELVHILSQYIKGDEARTVNGSLIAGTYLINEGPGSSGTMDVPMPSTHNPYLGNEKSSSWFNRNKKSFHAHFHGETPVHWKITGEVSGGGWTDNTARAVFIIQSLKFEYNINIEKVNLIGWSRGAVTCIRIANLLYDVFGTEIKCNIFGLDPVAGKDAGLTKEDTRKLPPNVENFIAILSSHERRESFKPQDLSRIVNSQNTKVVFLPMPGTHSQQVCRTEGLSEAYNISTTMAYACLRHWGTVFNTPPESCIVSARDLCEQYALMRYKMDKGVYQKQQTSGLKNIVIGINGMDKSLKRREFAKTSNMNQYVMGGKKGYWVNEHHRACFQQAFPHLYSVIFAMQPSSGNGWVSGKKRVTENLAGCTWLINSLLSRNFIEGLNNNQIWIANAGSGYYEVNDHLHATWPAQIPLF